jgi:hypothetical protein
MPPRGSNNRDGGQGDQERLSLANPSAGAKVLSIEMGLGIHRETLESLLSSALRSENTELDQILSALEKISNSLKSGAPNSRSLDNVCREPHRAL